MLLWCWFCQHLLVFSFCIFYSVFNIFNFVFFSLSFFSYFSSPSFSLFFLLLFAFYTSSPLPPLLFLPYIIHISLNYPEWVQWYIFFTRRDIFLSAIFAMPIRKLENLRRCHLLQSTGAFYGCLGNTILTLWLTRKCQLVSQIATVYGTLSFVLPISLCFVYLKSFHNLTSPSFRSQLYIGLYAYFWR